MGLFRRRRKPDAVSGPAEGRPDDTPVEAPATSARTVHERIEVTVERVWVSMMVRNPSAGSTIDGTAAAAGASAEADFRAERILEAPDPELPKGE
jgi:hypothetical protein